MSTKRNLVRGLVFCVLLRTISLGVDRPNILLIIADDLRPQLGCYGDPTVKTPRLDAFARRALRFDGAYVQCAICSPSRNSFLSGLRPATTGLRGFGKTLRETVPDVVTLPQYFKQHGYHAAGFGKIYHIYAETMRGSEDDPASWSQPIFLPKRPVWGPEQEKVRERRTAEALAAGKKLVRPHDWPFASAVDDPDVADESLQDGEIAAEAVKFLRERARRRAEPFFLAVGFFKPHLSYVAPKKYFDLYDHRKDPQESVNLAARADGAAAVTDLASRLAAGWTAACPAKQASAKSTP